MTTRVGSLSGGSVGGAAIDLGAQVISPDACSASARVAELVAAGLLAPVAPGAILGVREGAGVTHAAPGGVSGVGRHCLTSARLRVRREDFTSALAAVRPAVKCTPTTSVVHSEAQSSTHTRAPHSQPRAQLLLT